MDHLDVVGVGALNWDCLYSVDETVSDGETLIEGQSEGPGGSSANTIWTLARWGLKTGFIGVVGDDFEGHQLIAAFRSVGTDVARVRLQTNAASGKVIGFTDRAGRRALYVLPGANLSFEADMADLEYANQARVVHISPLAGEEPFHQLKELVSRLERNVSVSLAPGNLYSRLPWARMEPLLTRTFLVALTGDELKRMTGESDVPSGVRRIHKMGVQVVAVTLGPHGSYVSVGKEVIETPASPVRVVDSTGAGDVFSAGLLYGWLQGMEWQQSVLLATVAAGWCLQNVGARSGIPCVSDLLHQAGSSSLGRQEFQQV